MSNETPKSQIFGAEFMERFADNPAAIQMVEDVTSLARRYLDKYGVGSLDELPDSAIAEMEAEVESMSWGDKDV